MVRFALLIVAGLIALGPGAALAQATDALKLDGSAKTLWTPIAPYAALSAGRKVDGLGLFATLREQSIDLAGLGDGVVSGPTGSPFGTAAGLGWRRDNMSAMVGYMRPSLTKADWRSYDIHTTNFQERAHMGVGLSLHF